MASLRKLLLLCGFVASTVAVPVSQSNQCARYCSDENDFSLRPGSTYTYDYETTAVTTVQGVSQDKTQLQMTAHADIQVLSKCELSLRLRGVQLKQSDPNSPDYLVSLRGVRDFARSLEKHFLKFSFQNGKVEHVCPEENVPDWITNIQKGVLSAFQTHIVSPDLTIRTLETDIVGKCTAEYHSLGRSWQGMHTIRKVKDFSSCTERENIETFLQGTPYATDFQTRSLPVVKGHQECEQVLGNGFLQSSSCNEKLIFRPFSSGGNGVITAVTQKLTYADTTNRIFTGNDYRPTKQLLLYTHPKTEVNSARIFEETEAALRDLCDASKDEITLYVPRKFSAFVYKLKKLPLSSLKSFYQKSAQICPNNSKARKFFMDAIPLVNTVDSANFIYEMISKKAVSESESKIWLTSLAFITDATPEMIATFTPLLDGKYDQAILGISSFIRNFCKDKDCSNIPQVRAAVEKLSENLGENCFHADEKTVILSLKAIGNIGQLFGKENVLKACYKNPQLRTETRLAAIEGFRRVSCDLNRDDLLKTYGNYNEDTEIRIAAYLAVMKCSSINVIDEVKNVMMKEKINHVGSFIWTHLNALAKSKHPERQDIRQIVSNLYLMNKYASDARKFSTAHEATYFLESLDSGIHVDSHMIFSTDSYLPRSAMFNLTVDVFGKTSNLFQIDGRLEGLEHVVESFFGPSGYFPQKHVAKVLREKRSLSENKLNQIEAKYNENARPAQQAYGSLDVKVFGTSMWYNQYKHDSDGTTELKLLDIVTNLAEQHEKEYSRSFMFLDTTFTIPMTSGLPLKIAVNGTASVALKIGGKFDVKSFEQIDVLGHIEPSGAIEIASLLTVDAGNVARSGMRVVSTMHSSSVLDGKVEVKKGEVVKVQLNMPKDKIEVFNVESKLFLVHGAEEREKKNNKKEGTRLESCTGRYFNKILGVKFCSELELPSYRANTPLHPLNGPARFNIFIEKTDPSLKSYNFDAMWRTDMKNNYYQKHGILSFSTPNSRIDRDIKMEFNLNQEDNTIAFKLKTPIKRVGLTAKLLNGETQKKLDFSVSVDDKEFFSLQSDIRKSLEKNAVTYTPFFEVRIPSRKLVSLTGNMQLKHGQKYTAQVQLEHLTQKPILAKGNVEIGKRDRYDIEVSLSSFVLDGTVKGYAQLGDTMSSRITADYRIMESKMNKLSIVCKMRNLSANALIKYSGQLNVQASVLPEWNTELQFETMKTTGHIENMVTVSVGDGARSRIHTIKVEKILRYQGDLRNNKVEGSLKVSYPEKRINYGLTLNHENTMNTLKNSLQIQYDARKEIKTEISLKKNSDGPLSLASEFKLKYPGRESAIQAELSESNPQEYRGTVFCQWQEGKQVGVVVHYKNKSYGNRFKNEITGNLNLPNRPQISFTSTLGYEQNQFSGFVEANMGSDKYRMKTDLFLGHGLNYRLAGQTMIKNDIYSLDASLADAKEKISGNINVKMPNRYRISAKLEGKIGNSLKFVSLETYWDADRDTSKRFLLNGEMRNQNDGYEGKFNMQVRRRSIKGLIITGLQGDLFSSQWKTNNKVEFEWSSREKVSAVLSTSVFFDRSRQQVNNHVELTTPFYGYENLTFSVTHLYTNQQWDSELATLLPWGNDITMSSTGKYSIGRGSANVESSAKIQTSYSGYEEMHVIISHDHNLREIRNKAELKWGLDKIIQLNFNGANQPSIMKASASLISPFRKFKELSGEVTHHYRNNNYRTKGEFKWAPSKKISVNFEGNHELSGRRRICTVNIECSSPFRGYESTAMKIIYSNDGITVNTDTEASWNRNKITSSFSLSFRNQSYNKNMEGKVHISTPFRNYENIQLETSLDTNANSYKFNAEAQLPYRSAASFNSQGKLINMNDIEINAVVIGQIPRVMDSKRVSLDFVHKLQNLKLRSAFDASYGKDRLTILLMGLSETGYNSRNVEFSATVNTPFRNFEELKTEFNHNQRGSEYFTKLQINQNQQSGSLSHKLVLRDLWNFDSTLEAISTMSDLNGKMSIVQESNGRQIEHNSYILWNNNKKLQLTAQYMDKSFLKEVLVKVATPFRKFREIEIKSSYEKQDWEHKAVISAVWDRRNKMSLSGDLKNFRWESMSAQLEFLSPFEGHEFYSTAVKYDLSAPKKQVEVSLLWDVAERKSISLNGNFVYSSQLTSMEITLRTPFNHFEKTVLSAEYNAQLPERSLNAFYERGRRKVAFKGKTLIHRDSAEISAELNSPFEPIKDIGISSKYFMLRNGMKGEISLKLDRNNKYESAGEYELRQSSVKGSLSAKTPIRGYENVNAMFSGLYKDNKITSDFSYKWNNKLISFTSSMYFTSNEGDLLMNIQTPFTGYKEMKLTSMYKIQKGYGEGEIKAVLDGNQLYSGRIESKNGGEHLFDILLDMDSQYSPIKNVQLILTIDSNPDMYQLLSTLKWEDKKSDIHVLLNKRLGQFYEAKMKLNTPFEGFRLLSFDSSLRNDRNRFMDGRLILVTPFEYLRNLDIYAEYKNDDSGYLTVLKIDTPISLKLEGKVSNTRLNPLLASMDIEAPFMSFKTIKSSVEVNLNRWNNVQATFTTTSPQFTHECVLNFEHDNDALNLGVKVKSSSLPSTEAALSIKTNYQDMSDITAEATVEVFGSAHYLTGHYKTVKNNGEILIGMESSLLPQGKFQLKAWLVRRRNDKNIEGTISFTIPSNYYYTTAKYENKGDQITANFKVQSDIFTMDSQAKYINNDDRDIEAALTINTFDTDHSFVATLKNYEEEKVIQIKVDCPMATFLNPLSITGTLKHQDSTDVSLSVVSLNKEVRIAGNLKQSGWKKMEAFLTVNTPFRSLNMLRLDGRLKCDRLNENIDFGFQLESSNRNLPALGISAKQSSARGSEEVSVMLRLPIRNYESIQLLSNVHYNPDYSSADSRVTLSLPQNKFSIYGQYGIGKSRISGRGEVEKDNVKWSASGRIGQSDSKKDVSLTVTSPRSESYTVGGAYGSSGNQKQLALTYNNPNNQRYNLNTSISFENRDNFEIDFQVQTPFYEYRSLVGRIKHLFNSHNMLSNFEYSVNDRRGFLKIHNRFQRDGVKGTVQVSCPHHANLKDAKLSYSRVKKYTNIEDTLELDYNRAKQFKMEIILFEEKSSHFVLDVKPLELTISADRKQISNGQEIVFKSSCSTRVVSFRTSHQFSNRQFLHDAAFSWDEKAHKRISYDFRLADTDTGKELWGRFDTPIRSFMLKGNFTQASLIRSGGIDFYWDASRSSEKHMAIGVTQTEMNSNRQRSHKLQINLEHPKLSKDIVLTNLITFKPSEFYIKNELHYSRDRNYNLLMEVTGNDMSRGSRDSHYKGEFILRHPASRLDVRVIGELMDSKVESSANLMLSTLDSQQSQNIREIKGKIMKLRQEIDIMMRSNEEKMSVAGKMTGRNGEVDISLVRKSNEQQDLATNVRFSRRNRALDISLMNSRNTGLEISASFPKESVSLKVSHSDNGNMITDADMFIGLEQSKILKSRISWRPRLMRDLRIITGDTLRAFSKSSKESLTSFSSTFGEELSTKVASISQSMSEVVSPLIDDLNNGVLEIENDLRITSNSFWRMYRRNEFYMQDIVESYNNFKTYAKEMMDGLSLACDVLYNIAVEQLEDMYYRIYYSFLDFSEYMSGVITRMNNVAYKTWKQIKFCMTKCTMAGAKKIMKWCNSAMVKIQIMSSRMVFRFDRWIRSYAPYIIDGYYYTRHAADKIRYRWNSFSMGVSNYVANNKVCISLKNYGDSVLNTIIAFRDYEYAESAQAFLDRYYDLQLMETIINHPSVEYMSEVANSALRKSIEVYQSLGMDVVVSSAVENAKNYLQTMAINYAEEFLADFYRSQAGAKYIFTPERGYVSFEITLPTPKNSLLEVFDYKTYPEYQKITSLKTIVADYYEEFCFWDHYYRFTKYLTLSYWLPPFRAHALLSGNQHYISFDKRSYDFAGKCSYLLARDFVDGNFTAVVNYGTEDHMRRSLTILADGRKIDIGNDYKITLDDVKSESPIQIGHTIVMREGPNVRVDNEKKGFSIVCNFVHNYCSVSVSGFYFGKTAGLFGTYNHEPKLDWMTPGRHLVDDVETFANAWEVGQGICQSTENYATLPTNDQRVQNKCRSLFQKSTSEFRACFKQVNPETYLKMCITDLAAVMQNDHDDAICESAAAYFIECKSEGVPLKMPKHCVKCEKQDGTFMTEGQAIQYPRDGAVTAADVVFLIEEKQCNKDRVKYLSKMAQGIEDSFKQKGYRDIRYSVVAFGGDQIHAEPHVHTMDGWESGPLRSIDSALSSLVFGNGPVNMLEAIRFAASLNFRTGTTKSFILVKCSTCKSEELRAEYSEMLRTLLDGDITLHLLMDQRYEMKNPNKNSKARRVIGVDRKFAYTLKDVKDTRLSGDGDLLAQLKIPKDVCIPLALEVNGSTFDSQFLMETKKNTNKKFMDVFSRLVVRSSSDSNSDWGMCCECLATEDGVGKSTCQRCVSAEMASMISTDTSGIFDEMAHSRRSRVRNHKEARSV